MSCKCGEEAIVYRSDHGVVLCAGCWEAEGRVSMLFCGDLDPEYQRRKFGESAAEAGRKAAVRDINTFFDIIEGRT